MVTKAQKYRLGIFVVVMSILMLLFIIMITGQKMMQKRDSYSIVYQGSFKNSSSCSVCFMYSST